MFTVNRIHQTFSEGERVRHRSWGYWGRVTGEKLTHDVGAVTAFKLYVVFFPNIGKMICDPRLLERLPEKAAMLCKDDSRS